MIVWSVSWDALPKLIARVENLENEVFKKKNYIEIFSLKVLSNVFKEIFNIIYNIMSIKPEDMTLEQIKEQLALYNRLYYQRRRHEKDFMDTKRASPIRFHVVA